MNEKDNGGPAFPQDHRDKDGIGVQYFGMTLRDYFAAKAMASLITREDWDTEDEFYATWAYEMADSMLKARG